MIKPGDMVPSVEMRTDEGTPLALDDLKGRCLSIFLLGKDFTAIGERLIRVLTDQTERFHSLECSPVAVIGEEVDELAAYRRRNDVPFLLLSDQHFVLHQQITGTSTDKVAALVVDSAGAVVEIIPFLPPSELVRLALARAERLYTLRPMPPLVDDDE